MRTRFVRLIAILPLTVAPFAMLAQPSPFLREIAVSGKHHGSNVAVDSSGVYVTGTDNSRGFLHKYDFSGSQTWSRQWEFGSSIDGIPYSGGVHRLAAGENGVYLTWGGGTFPAYLAAFDHLGRALWHRQIFDGSEQIGLESLTVDGSRLHLAATKTSGFGATSLSIAVVRTYDLNGQQQWAREISRAEPPTHYRARGVAADATGVYLAGWAGPATGPSFSPFGFVRKYGPDGNELWSRQLPGVPGMDAVGVAADGSAIYVLAQAGAVPVLLKFDQAGNEVWTRDFGLAPNGLDSSLYSVWPTAVAADANGVFVTGQTNLALPESCMTGFQDAFVVGFDSAGERHWAHQYTGDLDYGSGEDIAVNDEGVFVAGSVSGCDPQGCSSSAVLAKIEHGGPLASGPGPLIYPSCVVNAASYIGGRLSPGEIVAIFGRALGPEAAIAPDVSWDSSFPTELAGVRALFNGIPAPVISVSSERITAVVPYAVAHEPSVDVVVEYVGERSNTVTMPVAAARPGLFTSDGSGVGHVAALNEDGSINSASNPAEKGSVIVLYATGEGLVEPGIAEGSILGPEPPKPNLPVSVSFCCYADQVWPGEVIYAGGTPGAVAGLLQVNVGISPDLYLDLDPERGVQVELEIGGRSAGLSNFVFIRGVQGGPPPAAQ